LIQDLKLGRGSNTSSALKDFPHFRTTQLQWADPLKSKPDIAENHAWERKTLS